MATPLPTIEIPSIDGWVRAFDQAMERAIRDHVDAVAARARAEHNYQNRTGDLEASTQVTHVSGRASDDTLEAGVEASMHYASNAAYWKGDFMQAAVDAEDGALEAKIEAELASAFAMDW